MNEQLKQAIRAVNEDGMSFRAASKKFQVPRSTLQRHVKIPNIKRVGRTPFFSPEDEETLYQMLKNCQVFQQPLSKPKFGKLAQKLAVQKGYEPRSFGKGFFRTFLRRHPDLKVQKKGIGREKKQTEESTWDVEKCDRYVEILTYLQDQKYLTDPRAIFCVESLENSISPDPVTGTISSPTRSKRRSKANGQHDAYPILVCASADGQAQRALILRGTNLVLESWFSESNQQEVIGQSQPGAFDADILAAFLKYQLVPHIRALEPPLEKSVLFLDSRWDYAYNLDIIETCFVNKIQIIGFPPGHANKLHALNKKELRKMTDIWFDYISKRDNPVKQIGVNNSLDHSVALAGHKFELRQILEEGFHQAGIYPYNPALIRATVAVLPSLPLPTPAAALSVSQGLVAHSHPVIPDLGAFVKSAENCFVELGAAYGVLDGPIRQAMNRFNDSMIQNLLAHLSGNHL